MDPLMLSVSAVILLLSSIITCGLLLKRTAKHRLTSTTAILSISDMANSFLTAFLIFFYQIYVSKDAYSRRQEHPESKFRFIYETKIWNNDSYSGNGTDLREDYSCDHCNFRSVFLQYALFFIPFSNAFISLLSFSVNLYASAMHINQRCFQWIEASNESRKFNNDERNCPVEALKDNSKERESDVKKKNIRKIIKKFKLSTNYTGFAIASQWLIPAIFSGAIQLGGFKNVNILNRSTEDLICAYTANFPFETCLKEQFHGSDISSTDTVATFSSFYNYVSSEDKLLWPNPNSSEVYDVVSKIRHIIKNSVNTSVLENEIEYIRDYYNITQPLSTANSRNESLTEYDNLIDKNELKSKTRFLRRTAQKKYDFNRNRNGSLIISSNSNKQNLKFKIPVYHCVKNLCIIPVNTLKIFFFINLTFIYFVPIFISTLLLIISYYKCFEIKKKLEYYRLKKDVEKSRVSVTSNELEKQDSPSKWLTEIDNQRDETSSGSQEKQSNVLCLTFEKMVCELSSKTDKLRKFIQIFKINILGAIVFWTPLFLEILSKVFFCSIVPKWLLEITFLSTIVFAALRNAVNIKVLKFDLDKKKLNTIHPN